MAEKIRPDLALVGVGNASGGEYGSVVIEGVGKIDQDTSCETLHVNGVATIRGQVTTRQFTLNGKLNVMGSVVSQVTSIEGHAHIRGKLLSDDITLNGILKLLGDCEAERFKARGGFVIEGLLNAGEVDIALHGQGKAAEIGGERIHVQREETPYLGKLFGWLVPALKSQLHAQIIEGDEVQLEATTAGIVRGNHVMIGPGCEIERVEYRSELIIHPEAKVALHIQL